MKAKFSHIFPAVAILLGMPLSLCAQLHESVSVEGTYLKDILHPDRINQLPRLSRYSMTEAAIPYASQGVSADFTPLAPAIPATSWGAQQSMAFKRGYIDLSAGSWLNANLSAGVGLIMTPNRRLDLRLQHNSTSLWHPYGDYANSRINYQENLGLSYAERFEDKGILSVSAQYHAGYFNYYGIDPKIYARHHRLTRAESDTKFIFPTQTLQDGAFRIGWTKDQNDSPILWNADAGIRYFGYRTATRELDVNLRGGFSSAVGKEGKAGIDANLDMLFYSSHEGVSTPDSYGALTLTPYYRWKKNAVSLKAGLDVDLVFNADGPLPEKHYGLIHLAPDVRFDVSARNVGFYIHLTGGSELHTLASVAEMDAYCNPHLLSTRPVYTPFDAGIGVQTTPFRGFSASLNLEYKVSKGVPLEGWYMAWLNYGRGLIPGLDFPIDATGYSLLSAERYDLSGVAASLQLDYTPAKFIDINGKISYSPQNGTTGTFNGFDRPRWILDSGLELRPVNALSLGVNYQYRGVRRIYTSCIIPAGASTAPAGAAPSSADETKLSGLRLPDITRLSAYVTWHISSAVALRVEADNLLNHRYIILPMTPTEGLAISGGLRILF